jgi:putative ABC transport system permease protein
MFFHYLKLGLRTIFKNRGFSLINVTGLSLGLASMMCLMMLVYQYHAIDGQHENGDRIYYLKSYNPDGSSYQQTTFPLLYEILNSCPEVAAGTHWQGWNVPWLQRGKVELQERSMYVDSGFFEVFSFPLLEGNPALALADKHSVVLSQKVARQLFGEEKALGKVVTAHGVVTVSDSVYLTVTGVYENMPASSSFQADVLIPVQLLLDNEDIRGAANWYNTFAENYLLLHEGADPKALDAKIDRIVKEHYAAEHQETTVRTVPLHELKSEGDPLRGTISRGAAAAAFFILLIMVVNLLNLNTALMFSRMREVSVRRILGSGRSKVIQQFCVENGLLVMAALLLGFYLFVQLLLPLINKVLGGGFGELSFHWQQHWPVWLGVVGVAAIIALLAGSLPAWYLSSLKVAEGVKGNIARTAGNSWLRNSFITLQFALAVMLIGVAFVLNSQLRYMKGASLGYNPQEVVVVNLNLEFKNKEQAESRFATVLDKLRAQPQVQAFSTTQVIPTAYHHNFNIYQDVESGKEVNLRHAASDAGYAQTYQIPIRQGRNFDDALAASEGASVLINQTAARAFGWDDPIGKQLKEKGGNEVHTVIGVMDDFHYGSLQQAINPLLHWYGGKPALGYNVSLSLRVADNHRQEVLAQLEQEFAAMPSRRSFRYHVVDELVEKQYALIEGIRMVTNYMALLTIFIAAMGLFGLVALFARRRVKEIGIRKVLGASVLDIARLLSKDFVKLVLLAIVVGTPLSWYIMQRWLEDFAYRIELSWWLFAAAGGLALLIALATVSAQAIKAARANPVKNLRTE